MAQNLYALLVGINHYDERAYVPPLRGCVNDVKAIQAYLEARVAQEGYQLHLHTLLNQQSTRNALIDGFRGHLQQAKAGDVAFFYYAGHGSQETAPEQFWPIEPDRLNETLVCYDSRVEGHWDLADKELAKLIAEVTENNPHVAIVMDCCHSGSGTRGDIDPVVGSRRAPVDRRERPLDSFIVSPTGVASRPVTRSLEGPTAGWQLPQGRHVLMAACQDIEEAKEYLGDGQPRGAFSYFLLDTLQKANGTLTYRDLFKRAHALVRSKLSAQSPQLEAPQLEDLDQPFLGGAIAPRTPYFTVSHHPEHGWVIDGGAVHGIQPPADGEATQLALFAFDSPAEQLQQLPNAIATATVTDVLPQLSRIETEATLDPETTYKAVVTDLPLPPLGVSLEGDEAGVEQIRQALQPSGAEASPSLYIREVADTASAQFRVLARGDEYLITRPTDDHPLVAQLAGYTSGTANQVVERLAHIARWTTIAALANSAGSQLPPNAIEMQLHHKNELVTTPQVELVYEQQNGEWQAPKFKVKLINTTQQRLYCALLDLTEQYSVSTPFFSGGGIWLDPQSDAWATITLHSGLTDEIPASISHSLWEQGITEYQDILKLIVSTAEFDPTLLKQEKLDKPATRTSRSFTSGRRSTLNRLMNRVITRDLGVEEEVDEVDDWITSQVTIVTVRPQEAAKIAPGRGISLSDQVVVQPHPQLKAKARLTTVSQSTRSLGAPLLPPLLREQTEAFQFTTSRGVDPGLSALELSEVTNPATVTPETPLTLLANTPLADGEHVLPVAYDGEFFLPLGYGRAQGQQTLITLERLPQVSQPDPGDQPAIITRSLSGAIRIFFQKVVTRKLGKDLSQKLGVSFEYPILAALERAGGAGGAGETERDFIYLADSGEVQSRVAQSSKIVIYIHGIIGDTEAMVPSVETAKVSVDGQLKSLRELYDVVLTYDYESINTTIAMNALKLRQRLQEIGLAPGHGKTIHIVAHSMGGLLARWFIEQEGGNEIVQHLIMLGTPNAGSPWPNVQAGLTTALSFAINGLSTVVWPLKLLGSVLEKIETIDVALDEMEPTSEFLAELATASDPKIPYSIVAGNTSLITADDKAALRARLKAKLGKLVELLFFGEANDIAVSVKSITNIPKGRSHPPQIQEVACNHLVYFTDPAGLAGLSWAVAQSFNSGPQSPAGGEVTPAEMLETPGEKSIQLAETPSAPNRSSLAIKIGTVLAVIVAVIAAIVWQQSRSQQPVPSGKQLTHFATAINIHNHI